MNNENQDTGDRVDCPAPRSDRGAAHSSSREDAPENRQDLRVVTLPEATCDRLRREMESILGIDMEYSDLHHGFAQRVLEALAARQPAPDQAEHVRTEQDGGQCSPFEAQECPRCGKCECENISNEFSISCPLHTWGSVHGGQW